MGLIKVLVVEDSDLVADVLTQALESDRKIKVVGRATNGQEALELVPKLAPDLITMDVWMPVMDGFETVERLMATNPTPILVITSSSLKEDVQLSLRMIAAGALDVMEKPTITDDYQWRHQQARLIAKVKMLSEVKVVTHLKGHSSLKGTAKTGDLKPPTQPKFSLPRQQTAPLPKPNLPTLPTVNFPVNPHYQMIAIASSTGGPTALLKILQNLPPNFPAGILIVQHISDGFTQGLVEWLRREIQLEIRIANDGDLPTPGVVLVAPDRLDMRIGFRRQIETSAEGQQILRPSGDILLASVARSIGNRSIGLVLTGMGADGAQGLRQIRQAGGYTIAQDEASSLIYGMPKAAYENGSVTEVLALNSIARRLIELCQIGHNLGADNRFGGET